MRIHFFTRRKQSGDEWPGRVNGNRAMRTLGSAEQHIYRSFEDVTKGGRERYR